MEPKELSTDPVVYYDGKKLSLLSEIPTISINTEPWSDLNQKITPVVKLITFDYECNLESRWYYFAYPNNWKKMHGMPKRSTKRYKHARKFSTKEARKVYKILQNATRR